MQHHACRQFVDSLGSLRTRLTAHAGARRLLIEEAADEVVGFRDLSRSDLRVNFQLR